MAEITNKVDLFSDVSKRIVEIRTSKGITQSEVAEKLNMERPNYSRIEKRGLKMSLEQLCEIAKALDVSLSEILGINNPEPIPIEGKKNEVALDFAMQYLVHTNKLEGELLFDKVTIFKTAVIFKKMLNIL